MSVDWHWSPADIAFLAANGRTMTAKQLGDALRCPPHVVRRRASRDDVKLLREKEAPGITPYSWTSERRAQAAREWQEGRSASEIARALGGVTRNAVIGVIHRMGLSGRPQVSRPRAAPRPTTVSGRQSHSANTRPRKSPAPALRLVHPIAAASEPVPAPTAPDVETVAYAHLNVRKHCGCHIDGDRWCAEPKVPGSVFCPTHRLVCITKAPKPIKPYHEGVPVYRTRHGAGTSALRSWGSDW